MNTTDFLRAVWPADGLFCIAVPLPIREGETKSRGYRHKVVATIREAVGVAKQVSATEDAYFCVHTLLKSRIADERKASGYAVRVQPNMRAARCFFFDLDVGDSEKKYANQRDALIGLQAFCKTVGLPKPLLTSSGGGVHVFWPLTDEIPSLKWRGYALKLKALARHHGLRADPQRIEDQSSVLRVAGTFNHKNGGKRPVKVLNKEPAATTDTEDFLGRVDDAMIRAGVSLTERAQSTLGAMPAGWESNIEQEFDGPPVGMVALINTCAQVKHYLLNAAGASEPEWYHMLNLVRFTENGHKNAHKASCKHPGYTVEKTDDKLHQLEQKGVKPASCLKLADVAGEEICAGCAFKGKVKNPLMAARYKDPAPAPVVVQPAGITAPPIVIPDPPYPFTRTKDGQIAMVSTNKDGEERNLIILGHDLFPIRLVRNPQNKTRQHEWRAILPREGASDFLIDADALYEQRKFNHALPNAGVDFDPANAQYVRQFMIAYINKLKEEADAEQQFNHLGWIEDQTQFIMPDKIMLPDGGAKPALLSPQAEGFSVAVKKKGTLERQVELMNFYSDPRYVAQQFFILCGLAAPIFFATGHHGVVVNATGDAGSSKSTSLYTAAAFWGQPEEYTINGTATGSTTNHRNEVMDTLSNLPICVDEITKMSPQDAVNMAMGVTQKEGRKRLNRDGTPKVTKGGNKATILLSTANTSLHNLLSTDNASGTAGSMRVFELLMRPLGIHEKPEGDEYMAALCENYGHIGEAFLAHVVPNIAAVATAVRAEMKAIDLKYRFEGAERFWSGAAAAAITTGRVAKKLGLIPFDVEYIREWVLEKQLPYMRGTVDDSYTAPIDQLAEYIETINAKMVITGQKFENGYYDVKQEARSELLAHYDTDGQRMYVLAKGFNDYCRRTGANPFKILLDLEDQKIVLNRRLNFTLGKGTTWAKTRSKCFELDMTNSQLVSSVDLPASPKAKPELRVVK